MIWRHCVHRREHRTIQNSLFTGACTNVTSKTTGITRAEYDRIGMYRQSQIGSTSRTERKQPGVYCILSDHLQNIVSFCYVYQVWWSSLIYSFISTSFGVCKFHPSAFCYCKNTFRRKLVSFLKLRCAFYINEHMYLKSVKPVRCGTYLLHAWRLRYSNCNNVSFVAAMISLTWFVRPAGPSPRRKQTNETF